jgi:hypothetical protein
VESDSHNQLPRHRCGTDCPGDHGGDIGSRRRGRHVDPLSSQGVLREVDVVVPESGQNKSTIQVDHLRPPGRKRRRDLGDHTIEESKISAATAQ